MKEGMDMFNRTVFKLQLAALLLTILAGCGGNGVQVTTAKLVSISVTPAATSIAIDTDQQYSATGIYSDNSTRDVTDLVNWDLSDPGVATISVETGTAPSNSG